MIAQSQSGTGKTAAFVLTMLSRVVIENSWPQVCVICVQSPGAGKYSVLWVDFLILILSDSIPCELYSACDTECVIGLNSLYGSHHR